MKKRTSSKQPTDQEMAAEYRLDYSQGKPNKFAARYASGRVAMVLDEDVAAVFKTPESVNKVLRALIASMPAVSKPKATSAASK